MVIAGNPAPPKSNPDEPAIETMNAVLGSDFGSRLNMNLREDKHWSYGAGSFIRDARGPRPFIAYAPVQTDKTKESIVELQKELREMVSGPAGPAGRARAGQGVAHAHAARQLGDHRRRRRHDRRDRGVRARRSLLRYVRGQGAGPDARERHERRGAHGPAGPPRLGDRGRPRPDRVRAPVARPGRDPPGGRRRQSPADLLTRPAGSQADASAGTLHPPTRSTHLDTGS